MFSFDEIKRLNDAVTKGDYSTSIIHYTSESNFLNIISSNELWFGRIDQMNDATEFTHYADAVRNVAHQLVPTAPSALVDALLTKFEQEIRIPTYISSWCEYEAEQPEGRLPMWVSYGDKAAGVAAVVDATQMQPSTISASRFNFFVFTSQVEYVRREAVAETAHNLLERIRDSDVLSNIPGSEALLGGILMARAPTSKHQAFKEEREVRFLTMPTFLENAGRFVPNGRIRNVGDREFFSLELKNWTKFDIDLRLSTILQKVLVGPLQQPERRLKRVRAQLDRIGLNDVPVEIVDIPLR